MVIDTLSIVPPFAIMLDVALMKSGGLRPKLESITGKSR